MKDFYILNEPVSMKDKRSIHDRRYNAAAVGWYLYKVGGRTEEGGWNTSRGIRLKVLRVL